MEAEPCMFSDRGVLVRWLDGPVETTVSDRNGGVVGSDGRWLRCRGRPRWDKAGVLRNRRERRAGRRDCNTVPVMQSPC